MYHLFASQGFGAKYDGPRLFDRTTVVGHLYLKSLGNITQMPHDPLEDGPGHICAIDGQSCMCEGRVFYGRKFADDKETQRADLKAVVERSHKAKMVSGQVKCSTSVFGDPLAK